MTKLFWVDCEPLYSAKCFVNEADRDEMALALWEEYVYFLTMRLMNWYDEPIMSGIEEAASENVYTWEGDVL